ncbi:MAG TPA: peptidoglycan-binding domain-containing protein [Chthoniobacterales bacterium]|nr:peptidoglycan-binding domain-containing protein [Chthoniobacterales bacterium]
MKTIGTLGIAITAGFALVQTAEAGRSSGRSFSGEPRFSAPTAHFSAPSRSFSSAPRSFSSGPRNFSSGPRHFSSGPRNFSSGPRRFSNPPATFRSTARFNSAAQFSAAPRFNNRSSAVAAGPRFSGATRFRNPDATRIPGRVNGSRTTDFNSATYNRSRFNPNGTGDRRGPRLDREREVARYGANWNRHWDRRRDHWWRGRRCHFRNNVWIVYEPFFWYPYSYGYGYHPYSPYYSTTYYDDSYAADEYAQSSYTTEPAYESDARVSEIQSALAREGYYDGPIDGDLGPATRNALRRYQRDRGLPVTGTIDRAVMQALQVR